MGSAASVEINEEEAKKRNRIIDQNLRQDKLDEAKVVKLLILGASESGKSTLAKQMRIIHENGFSKLDRMEFKQQIYSNVMQSMVDIIKAMEKMQIEFGTAEMQADADRIIKYKQLVDSGDFGLTGELTGSLRRMWNDVGVRACFVRSKEFQLNDSAEYYFMDLERLSEEAYIPTEQDVLRARFQTVGVIETHFKYRGNIFRMFDVGGQRSERRKWIHFFDNVTAIIFTVATSGYDQTLKEDSTKAKRRTFSKTHNWKDWLDYRASHFSGNPSRILILVRNWTLAKQKSEFYRPPHF